MTKPEVTRYTSACGNATLEIHDRTPTGEPWMVVVRYEQLATIHETGIRLKLTALGHGRGDALELAYDEATESLPVPQSVVESLFENVRNDDGE